MKYTFFILTILLLVSACEEKREAPAGLIPEDQMVLILADVSLIEAKYQRRIIQPGRNLREETLKNYSALFKKYGITSKQFADSYNYYQDDPEKMEAIYDKVLEELTRQEAAVKQASGKEEKKNRPANHYDTVTTGAPTP